MKKILLSLGLVAILLPFGASVGFSAEVQIPVRASVRTEAQVRAENNNSAGAVTYQEREELRMEAEEVRREHEEMKLEMATKREEVRVEMQARVEATKEMMEAKREELRIRTEAFKDEAKASVVNNLAEKLEKVNERITDSLLKHVETMNGLLLRTNERATKAVEAGLDVSTVTTKIDIASGKIAVAQTAILAQAEMIYAFDIESEATVRADMKAISDELRSDLSELKDLLKDARDSLRDAIVTLGQLLDAQTSVEVEVEAEGEVEVE